MKRFDEYADSAGGDLSRMIDATMGSSAERNDRTRPYDGQPQTVDGKRGSELVAGLTMRDVRDCFVKGVLRSTGETEHNSLVTKDVWKATDVYTVDATQLDMLAVSQNMLVEMERMMGIYPNVPPLRSTTPENDGV